MGVLLFCVGWICVTLKGPHIAWFTEISPLGSLPDRCCHFYLPLFTLQPNLPGPVWSVRSFTESTILEQPASVAQSVVRPYGDLEVAGSIPVDAGNIRSWRWSWNTSIFYDYFLPSTDSRRADVSFWRKCVHNTG